MKTRFCPSPTGLMHLGNARTALFSALVAHRQGDFLLRIEDTDAARSKPEYSTAIQQDLAWLGIDWQEGPEVGGDNGPYFQSQRQSIYDDYYASLIDRGFAYPCFCSEQHLAMTRKVQRASGQPPRYPGTCRHLSENEIAAKREQKIPETLRFRLAESKLIAFTDGAKGLQQFNTNDMGDFIIRRADGTASFMFCNALDDALMGVTLVIRGEDHLTNTPRQIAILEALDLAVPEYAHIALIAGSDGSPLSKRHGSRSLQQLREAGYLPSAVINYMARVGHSYDANELLSYDDLASHFSMLRLGKSAARYDEAQLRFWQKMAVNALNEETFWQWLGASALQVPAADKSLFFKTIQPNVLFPVEVDTWIDCLYHNKLQYSEEILNLFHSAGEAFFTLANQVVFEQGADFDAITGVLKTSLDVKGKALFMPLRAALTGRVHGPEMRDIVTLLGKERTATRFAVVIAILKG